MSARLTNTNAVSQQKSPIIVVVRDINDGNQKSIFIKNDPNDDISDQSDEESDSSHLQQTQVSYYDNKDTDVTDSGLIWSHRKPTENDTHATEYFLQLRGSDKYKQLFADKKYGKYKLWSEIAEEMNSAGYYVGEGREAAERCRQKFSNLEKGFLNYVKSVRTGNRKKDPPPFYDLMYHLVDPEDKLYKQEQHALIDAVRDSLQVELVTAKDTTTTMSDSAKTIEDIHPELINVSDHSHKMKKIKQKNEIITLLTKQHAEMMKFQREFLEKLDKHLTVQNEQREKMISSFVEAMKETKCECRKRKRDSSSSESENGPQNTQGVQTSSV